MSDHIRPNSELRSIEYPPGNRFTISQVHLCGLLEALNRRKIFAARVAEEYTHAVALSIYARSIDMPSHREHIQAVKDCAAILDAIESEL